MEGGGRWSFLDAVDKSSVTGVRIANLSTVRVPTLQFSTMLFNLNTAVLSLALLTGVFGAELKTGMIQCKVVVLICLSLF